MNQSIIDNLIQFAVASGLVVWLIKSIFSLYFSKDVEKFKSELEKEASSHRIRYEQLHTRRAETILELYKRFTRTEIAFTRLIHPFQEAGDVSLEEKGKIAVRSADEMQDYYFENRIFFEEDHAKEIDKLMDLFKKAWRRFKLSQTLRAMNQSHIEDWDKAWKMISEELPSAKQPLEEKFRNILGIGDK